MPEEILSLSDVCSYLKLSKSTAYLLAKRGDLPSSVVGRQLRFRKSKIDAWLEQQETLKAEKAHTKARTFRNRNSKRKGALHVR